ncbi:MAG TPA: hypothetical protein EYH34_06285 [Planctomycetes bacterium]|nr:hypothetical protein [Planctomycetota bacterium]
MSVHTRSRIQREIERHFEMRDLDIICRKRRRSYNIYWADDRSPLARLRATDEAGEVEIDWWDGDRWCPVKPHGLVLPLDEALEYITDDPDDLFLAEDDEEEEDKEEYAEEEDDEDEEYSKAAAQAFVRTLRGYMEEHVRELARAEIIWVIRCRLAVAVIAGAAGGLFTGAVAGAVMGLVSGLLVAVAAVVVVARARQATTRVVMSGFFGIPAAVGAAAVAGNLHQAIGPGTVGWVASMLVGAVCGLIASLTPVPGWLVGFWGGLLVAEQLCVWWGWRASVWGLAFIVVVTMVTARIAYKAARRFNDQLIDFSLLGSAARRSRSC